MENIEREAITAIMTKEIISDSLYLFKYCYSVTGTYDEKEKIFYDMYGNEFFPINDIDSLFSDLDKAFVDPAYIDEIKRFFPDDDDKSKDNMIINYDNVMKNKMFFVTIVENDKHPELYDIIIIQKKIDDVIDEMIGKAYLKENAKELIINLDGDGIDESLVDSNVIKMLADALKDEIDENKKLYFVCNVEKDSDSEEKSNDSKEISISKDFKDFGHSTFIVNTDEEEYTTKDRKEFKMDPIDLKKLRKNIKKKLVNQDGPLKRITAELARMQVKDNEKNKGILIMGDTGTGKTYMMDLLAKELNVPFLKIDSTQLTVPGYVGKDIEEYLWDLYLSTDRDIDKAEKAIVFFDEIDKKGSSNKSDISGQGVLNVLLKFLDGTTYDACNDSKYKDECVKIDTNNMIVVAGGAFTEISKQQNKNLNIGFNNNPVEEVKSDAFPDLEEFTKKAFMPEEFIGRFPIKIRLNKMDENSFERVLLESDDSTLKEEQRAFKKLGVKLTASPEYIKGVCKKAIKLKTGVRGLMGCVEESTWEAFEEVYCNPKRYKEIILGEESINDSKGYKKVLKRNKK